MKMKKAASNVIEMRQLEKETMKHKVNFDDVIRMKFLEQSARYLGVYVENRPTERLSISSVN
ncbi:hypothetical protein ACFL3P_04130 [Pseudomonadota bacterium]